MNDICTNTQEAIAWGRQLSSVCKNHLTDCQRCTSLLAELSIFDASFSDHISVVPTSDFADRVMARIAASEEVIGPIDRVGRWLEALFNVKSLEIGFASVGGVFAVGNLMHFVFGVIIPIST
jgi:hypothetical protein